MYIGRFVVAGRDSSGRLYVGYRVSGRSQPNRRIVMKDGVASVVPKEGVTYDNPFVAYPCFTRAASCLVASNGSQTSPIADRIAGGAGSAGDGAGLRDAIALPLLGLDYEHDHLHTPRIVAVADYEHDQAWFGIVTDSKIEVRRQEISPSSAYLIAVYEQVEVVPVEIKSEDPDGIAQELMNLPYENPICAIAAHIAEGEVVVGIR